MNIIMNCLKIMHLIYGHHVTKSFLDTKFIQKVSHFSQINKKISTYSEIKTHLVKNFNFLLNYHYFVGTCCSVAQVMFFDLVVTVKTLANNAQFRVQKKVDKSLEAKSGMIKGG